MAEQTAKRVSDLSCVKIYVVGVSDSGANTPVVKSFDAIQNFWARSFAAARADLAPALRLGAALFQRVTFNHSRRLGNLAICGTARIQG